MAARDSVVEKYQIVVALSSQRKWSVRYFGFTLITEGITHDEARKGFWHRDDRPEPMAEDYNKGNLRNLQTLNRSVEDSFRGMPAAGSEARQFASGRVSGGLGRLLLSQETRSKRQNQ
jgi:hypothetical protein